MFGSNGHYGHRWILNRYAGVPDNTPIPGLVEHGWNYNLGAVRDDILLPAPAPFFLWSERNLQECREVGGLDHVVPLGAPYLYLPPLEMPIDAEPGSLLVMPMHGWEGCQVGHDFELYAQQISAIEHRFRKIMVCLYWFEHQQERYRRPFESRGYQVTSAGKRDNNPNFLLDLRRLFLRHEYVSSNRVQTATFYALHLGRKFFIYGPKVGIEQHIDPMGKLYHAWQSQEYPMLLWENFKDETYPELAAAELGVPFVRTREALRDLFLWRPDQRPELEYRIKAHQKRARERVRLERLDKTKKALATFPYVGRYFRA